MVRPLSPLELKEMFARLPSKETAKAPRKSAARGKARSATVRKAAPKRTGARGAKRK